jgi:nitrogen fixation protein NifB
METLNSCQHLSVPPVEGQAVPTRPYVAVATMEGVLINQHLGEAQKLLIYGKLGAQTQGRIDFIEARTAPPPGGGPERWRHLADLLGDCRMLLVSGAGATPQKVLGEHGVAVTVCEGLIEEAVRRVYAGESLQAMTVRKPRACGVSCGGDMMGCGA